MKIDIEKLILTDLTEVKLVNSKGQEYVPIVHGHWVGDFCSVCGESALGDTDKFDIYGIIHSNYCPNCGAKMDEESMASVVINNGNANTVTNTDNAMSTETRGETMPYSMMFPKTVDEFMEKYKIVDSDEVYTNGAELVPIFRMKQWFEHVDAIPIEWIKEWVNNYCDREQEKLIEILLRTWNKNRQGEKECLSTVEAEPKPAYVIVDEDGNMECSNCGSSFCFDNYCAHCGAKLIGERKGEVEYAD